MASRDEHRTLQNRLIAARWLETQRGRPQYRPAPHLSHHVSRVVRPLSKKYGGSVSDLRQHWAEIIGPKFGKLTQPLKFTGSPRGRRLIIGAPGPAAALMMASKTQILDRLSAYLGRDYVKDIYVTQSRTRAETPNYRPVPERGLTAHKQAQLKTGLTRIADPDLRTALEKLGRQILSREGVTGDRHPERTPKPPQ